MDTDTAESKNEKRIKLIFRKISEAVTLIFLEMILAFVSILKISMKTKRQNKK